MNNQINGTGGDGLRGADHVDIEGLLAYAHGETHGAEADAVLQHSRTCRECGDELAVMLALTGTQVVAVAEDDTEVPDTSHRWLAMVAASVVLAVLLGVVLLTGRQRPGGPAPDVGVTRLATTEAPNELMLDFLFGASVPVASVEQAGSGFALIVEGRYDEAVTQLSVLYDARPGDGEVAAALGIGMYLAGDDSEPVEALLVQGRALRQQDFSDLAAWYLANLYLRRADVVHAREVLEDLSQWPDAPGTQARAVLEQLRSEIR